MNNLSEQLTDLSALIILIKIANVEHLRGKLVDLFFLRNKYALKYPLYQIRKPFTISFYFSTMLIGASCFIQRRGVIGALFLSSW